MEQVLPTAATQLAGQLQLVEQHGRLLSVSHKAKNGIVSKYRFLREQPDMNSTQVCEKRERIDNDSLYIHVRFSETIDNSTLLSFQKVHNLVFF